MATAFNSLTENTQYSRWYALLVLLFVVVLIYFIFFQGFVSEHGMMNQEIVDLEESRQEYTELSVQIPELQKRIQKVKEVVGDSTGFLVSDTYNLGSAELTRIFKNIVSNNTESSSQCNITNQTTTKDREPDKFEKIILKVRMRCQYEKIVNIMLDFNNHSPYLFVNNLYLEQRTIRRRRNATPTHPMLEVRFDLFAYMNKPIKAKSNKERRK